MSCTQIFGFDKSGAAYCAGETENAWYGAMSVWTYFEETYLPPYIPNYIKATSWYHSEMTYEEITARNGFAPSRLSSGNNGAVKEIWDLVDNKEVPMPDRIVLATTFDHILVSREDMPMVIAAFRQFGTQTPKTKKLPKTSLPEQADILEKMLTDTDCIAVGWNQSGINAKSWGNYDPGSDEATPYNCLNKHDHIWLSDLWKKPDEKEDKK